MFSSDSISGFLGLEAAEVLHNSSVGCGVGVIGIGADCGILGAQASGEEASINADEGIEGGGVTVGF